MKHITVSSTNFLNYYSVKIYCVHYVMFSAYGHVSCCGYLKSYYFHYALILNPFVAVRYY